jgi:ribosome-associated protein
MEALELAQKTIEAASDKQATDIVLLDARKVCDFADYFVICSGGSSRQLQSIYDEIEHVLKNKGAVPIHSEGTMDSGWMLLDYGAVIVHVFAETERDFYQLDKLWEEATPVVRIQ